MKRRQFIQNTLIAGALAGSAGTTIAANSKNKKTSSAITSPIIQKVTTAMMAMQRASWEHGVAMQAMLELGETDLLYLMAKEAVLRQTDDGRLSVVYTDNGNTDPACSGEPVLFAGNHFNDGELKAAANKMLNYLLNKAPKSEKGILYHHINSPQSWIDSMYMAPPFLAAIGEHKEAIKQIDGFRDFLWNNESKLYSHMWHDGKKEFPRKAFWGVGNGWAMAGIARVIDLLPKSFLKEKQKLAHNIIENMEGTLPFIREDGLFHDVIDDPSTFVETNFPQMFAYTIFKGIKSGWLPTSYLVVAKKMRLAAHSKVDNHGFVQGVCGAPHFNSSGRATEGQAFFLLMEAAFAKL